MADNHHHPECTTNQKNIHDLLPTNGIIYSQTIQGTSHVASNRDPQWSWDRSSATIWRSLGLNDINHNADRTMPGMTFCLMTQMDPSLRNCWDPFFVCHIVNRVWCTRITQVLPTKYVLNDCSELAMGDMHVNWGKGLAHIDFVKPSHLIYLLWNLALAKGKRTPSQGQGCKGSQGSVNFTNEMVPQTKAPLKLDGPQGDLWDPICGQDSHSECRIQVGNTLTLTWRIAGEMS